MLITFFSDNKQCDITIQGKNVVATFVDRPTSNHTMRTVLESKHTNQQLTREEQMRRMLEQIRKMPPIKTIEKKYSFEKGKGKSLRNALSFAINEALDVLMEE